MKAPRRAAAGAAEGIRPPLHRDPASCGSSTRRARTKCGAVPQCPLPQGGGLRLLLLESLLPGGCVVVLAPEEDMKRVGVWMDIIRRHEIAHCNGWPGDHRGALPIEDWAPEDNAYTPTAPPPVLNAALHFDKFALSAVTKTVAEVAGNLDQRAAQFITAAKGIGLAPQSQLTGQVLSDPATAVPLARAAGIGTDLSDEQWQEAHALALQTSRARQAENAAIAAQQAQPASRHCGLAIQKPCD